MTKKIIPGDPDKVTDYVYDDLGRMTSVIDENGTIAYVFDDANRLLSVTFPDDKTLAYEYDLVGNRTKVTYTDESYVEYTYDNLNRMDQVIDQEENVLADYSYNAVRRTGLQYLNGTSVSYAYNDASWVTALFNTQSEQGDISYFTYTHDEAGNRLTNTASWGTQTYSYDNIYQVTNVDYPEGYPFADMIYNYDPVGNRDSTVNGGTVGYENNELNEYTSVDWTTFTSDLRGNLTNNGSKVYSYDLENKLTAVNGNISYEYNPSGLRISKTVESNTINYVLDNNRVIEEWEDGELQRKFIYGVGIDEPLVMETGGNRYFYHFDALGSVQNLTDSTGTILATYKYDIYGDFQLSGNSQGNSYTFTGRRFDSENELFYYRTRYYNAGLGRFLQVDRIGYEDLVNLFIYTLNDPINIKDPGGNKCCCKESTCKIKIALPAADCTKDLEVTLKDYAKVTIETTGNVDVSKCHLHQEAKWENYYLITKVDEDLDDYPSHPAGDTGFTDKPSYTKSYLGSFRFTGKVYIEEIPEISSTWGIYAKRARYDKPGGEWNERWDECYSYIE